ncbi:hypothetical protein AML91_07925 [Paenibacillus jilunlii]|nr:hypothetical protein AML91_07925 [Paenibacillus jilunlii]
MYLQHFALNEWNASIVSGNTTLLFVLCGGISYSIMAQRMKERITEAASFRAKMLARTCHAYIRRWLRKNCRLEAFFTIKPAAVKWQPPVLNVQDAPLQGNSYCLRT